MEYLAGPVFEKSDSISTISASIISRCYYLNSDLNIFDLGDLGLAAVFNYVIDCNKIVKVGNKDNFT